MGTKFIYLSIALNVYVFRLCSSDWTLSEDKIQPIIVGGAIIAGFIACAGLNYLASYDNIMDLTTTISKILPKKLQTKIFIHQSIIRRAVKEGENQFFRFWTSENGKILLEDFEKKDVLDRMRPAKKIYNKTKLLENNTNNIRSKLLSLDPATIVMEEVIKPSRDGKFNIIEASHQLDIQLVMYLVTAGKIIPVNDDGKTIIFESTERLKKIYVTILETLLKALLEEDKNAYKEDDQSDIFLHIIENYDPSANLSTHRRLVSFCRKGKDKINRRNKTGQTVLHFVQNPELCQFWISTGADVDVLDNNYDTPLHMAIER